MPEGSLFFLSGSREHAEAWDAASGAVETRDRFPPRKIPPPRTQGTNIPVLFKIQDGTVEYFAVDVHISDAYILVSRLLTRLFRVW